MADVAPKPVSETGDKTATPDNPTNEPKKSRGRPPGTTAAAKSNTDVEQALAVLDNAYSFILLGLTMVGAPQAATDLAGKLESVQLQNRGFLTADRKLAQQIARIGQGTGRAGFIAVNVMALAPVVMTASNEIMAKRRSVEAAEETAE